MATDEDGNPKGAVRVSVRNEGGDSSVVQCDVEDNLNSVEECEKEVLVDSLGSRNVGSLVESAEVVMTKKEGCANIEGSGSDVQKKLCYENDSNSVPCKHVLKITEIQEGDSKRLLKECMLKDDSLKSVRDLADKELSWYHWVEGLLMRRRFDDLGGLKQQICLPKEDREKVLKLAHESFGHQGKAKVTHHIQKSFYWPGMWKDVDKHCKSCDVCLRINKAIPRQAPMKEREVLMVPFERVCVDLVGPLPKSKKGHIHILTYIDVASRWPVDGQRPFL